MTNDTIEAITIPAQLLYWGRLSPTDTTAKLAKQNFHFEKVLPISADLLHISRVKLLDGSSVLVGIEPERFRSYLSNRGDISPSTWELLPDKFPDYVVIEGSDPRDYLGQLNLLHGEFEPEPRRKLRLRNAWAVNLGLIFAMGCLLWGVDRRAQKLEEHAIALNQQTEKIINSILPLQSKDRHPELRLTMELRRLEQAASGSGADDQDILAVLTGLWRVWPKELRTQIEVMSAMQDRLVIRGEVASLAEAELITQACRNLDATLRLRLQPLQAQNSEKGASFLLTFVRQDSLSGGTP
jgi:hypothetical protein